jgi:hypothetical protein
VFDGTNYLSCSASGLPAGTSPAALVVLGNHTGFGRNYAIGYDGSGNSRNLSNDQISGGFAWVGGSADFYSPTTWASDAIVIGNVIASGNIDLSYQQSASGAVINGTVANNVGTPGTLYVGRGSYAPAWVNGDVIQEVVVTNRSITNTEREILEGYLAWKYTTTISLSPSHPYKNSPPLK